MINVKRDIEWQLRFKLLAYITVRIFDFLFVFASMHNKCHRWSGIREVNFFQQKSHKDIV
jgi:hypothetical protein